MFICWLEHQKGYLFSEVTSWDIIHVLLTFMEQKWHQCCDVWLLSVCFWWFWCWKEWKGSFPNSGSYQWLPQRNKLVRAQTTKLRNRLVNSYRFFISVSLGGCMGVPHLQRHKELGGKVASTSDGRDGETISLVVGWGNWAAVRRILSVFMALVLDGFVEVSGWLWGQELASRRCLRLYGGNPMVEDCLWRQKLRPEKNWDWETHTT